MISHRMFNNKAAISHKAEFQHQTERFMIFVCCEFPIVMILAPQAEIRTMGWNPFKNSPYIMAKLKMVKKSNLQMLNSFAIPYWNVFAIWTPSIRQCNLLVLSKLRDKHFQTGKKMLPYGKKKFCILQINILPFQFMPQWNELLLLNFVQLQFYNKFIEIISYQMWNVNNCYFKKVLVSLWLVLRWGH